MSPLLPVIGVIVLLAYARAAIYAAARAAARAAIYAAEASVCAAELEAQAEIIRGIFEP